MPLPGSAFAFLVVLHLPAALELRKAGSGLDLEVLLIINFGGRKKE